AGGFEQGILPRSDLDVRAGQAVAQSGVTPWVGNNGQLSAVQDGELGEASGVRAAGEGDDLIVRRVATDQVERVLTDRAGGPQHGNPSRQPDRPGFDLDAERCE